MANPSLAALLVAVERWQTAEQAGGMVGADWDEPEKAYAELVRFDTASLRAAAHQHAEALRERADPVDNISQAEVIRAAADFLDSSDA